MMQAESDGFAAIAAMLDPELSVASLHGALVGGLCADTGARLSASALGACLMDREALNIVMEILQPEDFYDTTHRAAFEVIFGIQEYFSKDASNFVASV